MLPSVTMRVAFVLTVLSLSLTLWIAASAQTKTATSSPAPRDSPAPGGPAGLFTVFDDAMLRKGEFTFSLAYSNFDRDPGNIDDSEYALIPNNGIVTIKPNSPSSESRNAGLPVGFQPSSDPYGFGSQLWVGHRNGREPAILPDQPPLVRSFAASASSITPCAPGYQPKSAALPNSTTVTLTTNATDPDGDTLFYSYDVTGGYITGEGASVTWDLSGMEPGTYMATVDVDDGCGCITSATTTVTITGFLTVGSSDCRENTSGDAVTYEKAGNYDYFQSDYRAAFAHYQQALFIYRRLRDHKGAVRILTNMGVTHRAVGETARALDSFNEALSILANAGEDVDDTSLLYNVALAKMDSGAVAQALSYFEKAMLRIRASKPENKAHRGLEGLTLNGMGSVYASLGESAKAFNYYHQALVIFEESNDRVSQAIALNNIGKLYNMLGAYADALDYYNRVLIIRRAMRDRRGEAGVLYDIGNVYFNQGDVDKSSQCYELSLILFRSIKDQAGESLNLTGLGRTYTASKQFPKALEVYDSARAMAVGIGNRRALATTLAEIGKLYQIQNDRQKALSYYSRALELMSAVDDKNGEAASLYEMASLTRDLGDLEESRKFIERAISTVESQRANAPRSELRSAYSASIQEFYGLYIDLLVSLNARHPSEGFDGLAFQASERARARSLLDSLVEARAAMTDVDPVLLRRQQDARQALNELATKQMRLLTEPHSEQQAEAIAKEVDASFREYQEVNTILRSQSPRYAALAQGQPSNLKQTQQLLDDDTLLLSYALGNARSFLFAVKADSISIYVLPSRSQIETTALNAYSLLIRNHVAAQNKSSTQGVGNPVDSERSFESVNRQLSEILISPARKYLGSKRLLIVAPGALQIVPFAALLAGNRPLILDHEIVSLPSASTLEILRNESNGRKSPPKAVAVIADPVLTKNDGRIERPELVKQPGKRPNQNVVDYHFQRLLSTRWEAEQIAALVPPSESLLATDFAANREIVVSDKLSQYRIVHFATHGILNAQYPDLSGIVLSLFDKDGHPQDGFLRLNDIYQMKLPVDLVVLSGCDTGIGKEVRGEGLNSLTRGFMYAGTPRVVFSLWPVDDRATAELMVRFYREMLVEKLPAAAALRTAQIEMSRDNRWSSPYFWASFVFQGEYK